MATAILKYDLDDFDDRQAHLRAVKSLDMALVLWEFARNTRKKIEHKFDVQEDVNWNDVLQETFDSFFELLEEHNVDVDELGG